MIQRLQITLLLAIVASATAWEIIVRPPEAILATMKTGQNIVISCVVNDGENTVEADQQTWRKDGGVIESSGRVRSNGGRLMIMSAQSEDAGVYSCDVTYDGETITKDVNVVFFKAVSFTDAPLEQHPVVGERAEIICRVAGDPVPQMQWRRGNDILADADSIRDYEFKENGQVLVILEFDAKKDDDIYTCQAEQPSSGTFETRDITVSGHAKPVIVSPPTPTAEVMEGNDVTFKCGATGTPAPEFTWWKSDKQLTSSDKYSIVDGVLTIASTYAGDVGVYTCRAENVIGIDESFVELDVFLKPTMDNIPPVIAAIGDSVTLECTFTGDGDINAYWFFNGRVMDGQTDNVDEEHADRYTVIRTDSSITLTISSLTLTDAAEYKCESNNEAGTTFRTTIIKIEHAPIIVQHTDQTLRSYAGNHVRLMCVVDAVPAPTWTWYGPNGERIAIDGRKFVDRRPIDEPLMTELEIITEEHSDYGTYKCEASNNVYNENASQDQSSAQITVVQILSPPVLTTLMFNGTHPNYALASMPALTHVDIAHRPTVLRFEYVLESVYNDANDAFGKDFVWTNEDDVTEIVLSFVESNMYTVGGMTPETDYRIRVRAENEAGLSEWTDAEPYATSAPRAPASPKFVEPNSVCNSMCSISWREPNAHGSPITGYVMYYAVDDGLLGSTPSSFTRVPEDGVLPASSHSHDMRMFLADTKYIVRITAVNQLGEGDFEQTSITTPIDMQTSSSSMSPWAVVVIIAIVLLIVFCAIDGLCYAMRECGFLWCMRSSLCGHVENEKGARTETNIECGTSSKTPQSVLTIDEQTERTPMM